MLHHYEAVNAVYAFMQSNLVNENRINRSISNILADYYLVNMKMRTDSFQFNKYTVYY